ncbi:SufE family protein [Paralimibaculum aggregatum]|uniref:SufE family protein n=1 Tax=Paralimibaculum aggregatum TaxID=3036245 RepID=A0ABQ6LGV2_9RHOB|nr:SufE family protein [Limibaculum sp. NKW23]GMG81309.1 SufE family protein [Limibaculum sp. NKW23]
MASEAFEDLVAEFELFDDWEERYRYVIELGKAMPPLGEGERVPAHKVEGCVSQVWLVPELAGAGADARLDFRGDSDAMIVRGLIAVLHRLFAGQRLADVARTDAHAELARLGLDTALSAQRSNGLRAMVARLQGLARAAAPA